jgi:hypothetical protein
MNTNGLLACKRVFATGSSDSNYFVKVGANGDSEIVGDLLVGGYLAVAGTSILAGEVEVPNADIANTENIITYTVDSSAYPIYPSFVKLCPAGTISKASASPALVPEGTLLVPMDGYYSFTIQVNLDNVGDVSGSVEWMETFLDTSGAPIVGISGTSNIIDVIENTTNVVRYVYSGIIMGKLTKGEYLNLYHQESNQAAFTFDATSSILVAYQYLGNKPI